MLFTAVWGMILRSKMTSAKERESMKDMDISDNYRPHEQSEADTLQF